MTDLTKNTTAFCLLDEATRQALIAHPGDLDYLNSDGLWCPSAVPRSHLSKGVVYRAVRLPEVIWVDDDYRAFSYPAMDRRRFVEQPE